MFCICSTIVLHNIHGWCYCCTTRNICVFSGYSTMWLCAPMVPESDWLLVSCSFHQQFISCKCSMGMDGLRKGYKRSISSWGFWSAHYYLINLFLLVRGWTTKNRIGLSPPPMFIYIAIVTKVPQKGLEFQEACPHKIHARPPHYLGEMLPQLWVCYGYWYLLYSWFVVVLCFLLNTPPPHPQAFVFFPAFNFSCLPLRMHAYQQGRIEPP